MTNHWLETVNKEIEETENLYEQFFTVEIPLDMTYERLLQLAEMDFTNDHWYHINVVSEADAPATYTVDLANKTVIWGYGC